MSSRSFRRRNSRRRRRAEAGGAAPENRTPGAPAEGGLPEGRSAEQGPARGPSGTPRADDAAPDRQGSPRDSGPRGNARGGGTRRDGSRRREDRRRDAERRRGGEGGREPSRGGRRERPTAEPAQTRPAVPLVVPDCPICGKPVRELSSAVTHRASGQPAHFDCIVRELRESNEIGAEEKVCYLGGGSFGVLEFPPPGGQSRFVIKRRIQYEEKETPHDWKKPLQISC